MTRPRRRRRAVGPPGAWPAPADAAVEAAREPAAEQDADDDERLLRERPPHHDRT